MGESRVITVSINQNKLSDRKPWLSVALDDSELYDFTAEADEIKVIGGEDYTNVWDKVHALRAQLSAVTTERDECKNETIEECVRALAEEWEILERDNADDFFQPAMQAQTTVCQRVIEALKIKPAPSEEPLSKSVRKRLAVQRGEPQ